MNSLKRELESFRELFGPWSIEDVETRRSELTFAVKFRRSPEDSRTKLIPIYRFNLENQRMKRYKFYLRMRSFSDDNQFEYDGVTRREGLIAEELLDLTMANCATAAQLVEAVGQGKVGRSPLRLVHSRRSNLVYVVSESSWREYSQLRS